MKRFIITGLAMSPPGSMGGNTKIALELARFLSKTKQVVIIIQKDKIKTVTDNIEINDNILIYPIEPSRHSSLLYLFHDAWHYTKELEKAFTALSVQPGEPVFNCSNFLSEALSSFRIKPKFKFLWIPSAFLFIPSPYENLKYGYKFPFFLYAFLYIYERSIFCLLKMRGDLFVITNDCDKKYFPEKLRARIFAFYGGVNLEQIKAVSDEPAVIKYEVVFCSRLCVQKGINPFLDIWSLVVHKLPNARLAIIGNGLPAFEKKLKVKADRLGISHTLSWLGYVNNEEKYRIYRSARLFVHPTVYDNNGMVAAEALCTGLPVIMNDLGSLKELYTTGCAKSDFTKRKETADLISHLLLDASSYKTIKPNPSDIDKLRLAWSWESRCSALERFLTSTTGVAMPLDTCKAQEPLVIISVVRDYQMYNRCVAHNSHANMHTLHAIDNRSQNDHISILYNQFLDAYDYTKPAWLMFCHEDFELKQDVSPLLELLDKTVLYGPIGAKTSIRYFGMYYVWQLLGQITESNKDGSNPRLIGKPVPAGTPIETFDCQCLLVHSDLIKQTGLRFDDHLSFDLYVEDFCIQAKESFNIPSLILPFISQHWSSGKVNTRYYQQVRYLNAKYPTCCYTGTSSYSIGMPNRIRQINDLIKRLLRQLSHRMLSH